MHAEIETQTGNESIFKKVDYLLPKNNESHMAVHGNARYKAICPWIKNNASTTKLLAKVNKIE